MEIVFNKIFIRVARNLKKYEFFISCDILKYTYN